MPIMNDLNFQKSDHSPQQLFQNTIRINNMQAATNIFITGTNRGLGKELVKLLHHTRPEAKIHISSRNTPEELSQQWEKEIPGHIFATYQIDLNDPTSIAKNVQLARDRNIQFDYIVANAAVGCDYGQVIPSEEVAKSTLFTNVNSTINFIKQFIPLLNKNGRVVVVSSIMGSLDVHHQQFRDRLSNPSITEDEILHIANDYVASAIKKDMGHYHWSAYRTSKALINSWSRFILPTYLKGNQTAVCLHPGWCQTDMGGKNATLTAQQGAKKIYDGIYVEKVEAGKFFNDKFCDYVACQ